MYEPYIAIGGGAILFLLGLVSVWRPREFWGQDVDRVEGKAAQLRKTMAQRRLQVGTVGFLVVGMGFAAIGVWQLINGG